MPCESLVSNSIAIEEILACWQEKNVYREQPSRRRRTRCGIGRMFGSRRVGGFTGVETGVVYES